ncbi:Rieske (2Fe-2S) protein [Pedococcus sp. NPDC057267]|uniref:Rieske (2Fe-2S) protein n=1 Tax=Pedococcus sp. NPDC057267 TaxID=3346077 RepID=UPI00362ACCC1
MTHPEDHSATGPTRRTLLAIAGIAGVGVVAGCSSGQDVGSAVDSATSSAKEAVKQAIDKATIPVGGGKIFPDQKVVVTQPKAGEFKAFTAVCTHQGCIVSKVENGVITCGSPCGHGSEYDAATGQVKVGPAPSPLAEKKVTISTDGITVS